MTVIDLSILVPSIFLIVLGISIVLAELIDMTIDWINRNAEGYEDHVDDL